MPSRDLLRGSLASRPGMREAKVAVLCLGALLAGLVAAALIPFLPFACALLAATVLGSVWAGLAGAALGSIALSAVMLLFACQIGYGLGLVVAAAVGRRPARRGAGGDEPTATAARRLRTGNGPS